MAEPKSESKAMRVEKDNHEALVASWVTLTTELAERVTATCFGVARDVRAEVHKNVAATMNFVSESQQSMMKMARNIDERIDKLTAETIDVAESMTLSIIRTVRDTSHGVQQLTGQISGQLTRVREAPRAVS
jgi:hypothetical protein